MSSSEQKSRRLARLPFRRSRIRGVGPRPPCFGEQNRRTIVGLVSRLALAVDPRSAGPLAGCSRHYPKPRITPPRRAAQRPHLPPRPQAWGTSHAVLRAQILEVFVEPLRLQALLKLRLHFIVRRHLCSALVLDQDHMPAELRLHRLRR